MTAFSKLQICSRRLQSHLNVAFNLQGGVAQASEHNYNKHFQQACAYSLLARHNEHHSMYAQQQRSLWKKVPLENRDLESGLPLRHPEKGLLVYVGKLNSAVRSLKLLSLSTSMLALSAQPFIMHAAQDAAAAKIGVMGTMSLLVFSTPLLLHIITRKYVTDVYFNEETKIFTLAKRSFFLRRQEVQFKAEDVKKPLIGGMFVTHTVKDVPYFMEMTEFRSKEVYVHMVGYDKPIDLGIKDPNAHLKPKKKFGLFEEEEKKPEGEVKEENASVLWKSRMLHDEDDDANVKQVKKGSY